MDADAVGDRFVLRGVQDGDRIETGEGSTPVTEVLRAAGVAASLRPVSPVIAVDGKLAAIVGVRVAAWAASRTGGCVVVERKVST